MKTALALTLGHNSSAVLIQDGEIIAGYEQERFSAKKSDSAFPKDAIKELALRYDLPSDTTVCVGHWFLDHQLPPANKYWDPDYIKQMFPDGEILSLDSQFSHHDSHLEAAMVFAGKNFAPSYHALVMDGFGSSGECISVYAVNKGSYRLLERWFGFDKSLGMLYQYATAFLGMKMHNHEYKMLAYEVHLHALNYDVKRLDELVAKCADEWLTKMFRHQIHPGTDPLISLEALPNIQVNIEQMLGDVLIELDAGDVDIHDKRCIISYFVQHVVESVVLSLAKVYSPENLLLVGGLFYNVKLNHLLADMVEKFAAMPLAGDQGAGLGVYYGNLGRFEWPGHLAWGHRDLSNVSGDGIIVVEDMAEAVDTAHYELTNNRMVNVVRGAMEFGPRSLCNTATLAIPTMDVVERINKMNDRTTVMPMAPAMTAEQAAEYLNGLDNIVGSLEYMIVTRDVKLSAMDKLQGASHFYKLKSKATCRPQIISENDLFMTTLLNEFGPLINTSFNYHGVPIAFDKETIEYSHNMQNQVEPITTIVIK